MTQTEFESWVEFYMDQPFDDAHRYQRPAALVAHSMTGGDMDDRLTWLRGGRGLIEGGSADERFSEADLRSFEALGLNMKRKK